MVPASARRASGATSQFKKDQNKCFEFHVENSFYRTTET